MARARRTKSKVPGEAMALYIFGGLVFVIGSMLLIGSIASRAFWADLRENGVSVPVFIDYKAVSERYSSDGQDSWFVWCKPDRELTAEERRIWDLAIADTQGIPNARGLLPIAEWGDTVALHVGTTDPPGYGIGSRHTLMVSPDKQGFPAEFFEFLWGSLVMIAVAILSLWGGWKFQVRARDRYRRT